MIKIWKGVIQLIYKDNRLNFIHKFTLIYSHCVI